MAEFGHVYSNLMLAAGFEATLDQRGARKPGDRSDVRNRTFRLDRSVTLARPKVSVRSAHSIATIHDEIGLNTRRADSTVRDSIIDAIDVVRAELCCQHALRIRRPRKNHQATRILV